MTTRNPIACTVDLAAPGRNAGYLRLPHSVHRSAYGHIPVPVVSLVGADEGPSVLLMGGNHGDEYEGQIIVSQLIRELRPADVRGRITLLPMANFPAAQAGLRVSPLDGGNLNRSFTEDAPAGPTRTIAHYIEHVLMGGIECLLDLHSGGSSLYCVPHAFVAPGDDPRRAATCTALVDALGVGHLVHTEPENEGWFATSAAARQGAVGVTVELGGGGTVDPEIRERAHAGVLRALGALGAYAGPILERPPLSDTRREYRREALVFADDTGLCEPLARAGQPVTAGQPGARVHFPETPGKPPVEIACEQSAVILAHRVPARVVRGDCLFHLGLVD